MSEPRLVQNSDGLASEVLELPSGPSVAVMPFEVVGDAKEADWIARGLATDISQRLTKHTDLRVVGRATTIRYEGSGVDPVSAGREIRVNFVLTGTVRESGDQLRITTGLTSTKDASNIWAST